MTDKMHMLTVTVSSVLKNWGHLIARLEPNSLSSEQFKQLVCDYCAEPLTTENLAVIQDLEKRVIEIEADLEVSVELYIVEQWQ